MVVTPEPRAGLAPLAWAQWQRVPFPGLPSPLCSSSTPFMGTGAQITEAVSVSGPLCPVPPSEGPGTCLQCQ